jgi:thiol-disulfide isomerase/thioredoxin
MIFPTFRFGGIGIIARFIVHIPLPMFRNLANLLSQKSSLQLLLWGTFNIGIGFPIVSCQSKAPSENVTTTEAPPFVLSDAQFQRLDGTEFGLSAEQKTYTVLHFWATWCKPCLAEFPELKAALPRLQSDSVAFFLATEEDLDQIRSFEEKRNFGLEFLHLKKGTLADFEVHALPTTLVIDRQGKVVYRHMGQLNWQDVTSIEDLISKQP